MKLTALLAASIFAFGPMFADVQAQSLRIATFNVNYGNADTDKIVAAIQLSKADIVCIQETSEQIYTALRNRLSEEYPYRETVGEFAFASKFELSNTQYHESERFYSTVLAWDEQRIRVANIHLSPVFLPEKPNLLQVLRAVNEKDDRNRTAMAGILKQLDSVIPTVIVGDFNGISESNAPRFLRESGFVDSYAAIHENADSHRTWDWRQMQALEPEYRSNELKFADLASNMRFGLRVDYIFHTKRFRTTSSEIIASGGSDHFPVVSELQIVE